MKKEPKHFRQGDVLIREVESIPENTRPIPLEGGRVILAHGEVTGHSHALAPKGIHFLMATEPSSGGAQIQRRYLEVKAGGGAFLRHEEHAEIQIPRGKYEITIQKEYAPEAIRNVAD